MTNNNIPENNEDFDIDVEDIGATEAELAEYFGVDENAPMEYLYYIVGDRPLRIGHIAPEVPVIAEILDGETKKFEINNLYISYVAENTDVIELSREEFVDACLKRGVKPLAEK